MKILEVGRYKNGYNIYGVAPFVYEQGMALFDIGCNVKFYSLTKNYLKEIFRLKKLILSEKPLIVHAHFGLTGISSVLASKLIKKSHRPKIVVTFHNGEILKWYVNAITSFFSLFADYVIYVAQHIRDSVYFKAATYNIIPCGINLHDLQIIDYNTVRGELNFENDTKYILFGGAYANKRKNVDILNRALKNIDQNIKVKMFEMNGMSRQQCVKLMCACDVFVLPTKSEGSPQALKEAMACNCPIISTDVADIGFLLGNIPGHYILRNSLQRKSSWVEDENSESELVSLLNCAFLFNGRTQGRQRIIELKLDNIQVAKKLMDIYYDLIKIENK